MSDKLRSGRENPADKKTDPSGPTRLINPTVRNYLETMSLQLFYGGYVIHPIGENVFNLGIGEVGGIPLPEDLYEVYQRFMQSEGLATLVTRYSGTLGELETNRLVAEQLNRWLGQEQFDEGTVVSLDGGQNAVEVAIRAFTSPLGSQASRKQYVLFAAPTYPYLSAIISSHAGIQSFLAFSAEEFTRGVEHYCNPAVGVILLNVPHNPLGYALSPQQVERVNTVARAHDCAIVVDGVYANYPEDAGVGQALGLLDPERTIYVDSFSKKYGLPGLRVGFALSAVKELTYAMRFIKMSESLTPSNGKLAFAGHLLSHYPEAPAAIGAEVRQRRERFLQKFDFAGLPGVRIIGEQSNPFYLPLDISELAARTGLTDAEVGTHCLEKFNVRTFPGAFVYPNRALEHTTFEGAGRQNPHGPAPFFPPNFPEGSQIVYAPDYLEARRPLLRLSFGMETRVEGAAEALTSALQTLA